MKIAIFFGENMPMEKYDYYIAAENGAVFLNKIGITPDLVISDFDTVNKEEIIAKEILSLERLKDNSDLDACIEHALTLTSPKNIHIYGKEYGRLDHFLYQANSLYKYVGIKMFFDNSILCCYSKDSEFEYKTKYVSLFPKDSDFETFGLRWELKGRYIDGFSSLSNEFIAHNANLKINSGKVLVIYSN